MDPAGIISDHSFITWMINFTSHPPIASRKAIRSWKRVNRTDFRQALKDSPLCAKIPDQASSEELFSLNETVLRELADRFAPERTVTIRRQPIAVWYDDESRDLRRRSKSAIGDLGWPRIELPGYDTSENVTEPTEPKKKIIGRCASQRIRVSRGSSGKCSHR